MKKIDTFDEKKASLSTWIFNITKNTLIDHYRSKHIDYELLDNYEYLDESETVSATELADLANALNKISQEEKEIVVLRYYEGYTLKEVAEKMKLSYGVVKLRHNSALEKLKDYLS